MNQFILIPVYPINPERNETTFSSCGILYSCYPARISPLIGMIQTRLLHITPSAKFIDSLFRFFQFSLFWLAIFIGLLFKILLFSRLLRDQKRVHLLLECLNNRRPKESVNPAPIIHLKQTFYHCPITTFTVYPFFFSSLFLLIARISCAARSCHQNLASIRSLSFSAFLHRSQH